MKKLTIMVIPDGSDATSNYRVPKFLIRLAMVTSLGCAGLIGYLSFDYFQLLGFRSTYHTLASENEGLKGEARILMANLEDVKRSLRQVQDYTSKLNELTEIKATKVSKKTGIGKKQSIGPLSSEEAAEQDRIYAAPDKRIPIGVNTDNLVFKPVFTRLASIGEEAQGQALELQQLLSNLSQQKSLLSSIPAITPVNGWITSGYGTRISPFTGKKGKHKGIDIAAPVGTPIFAPADGVVIFTGAKAGFGNFIMIAHGYGVVSRYGHNHQNMVQPGQRIKRGDQIGTVGQSGRTTGPHLHYEVWVNGRDQNPRRFILDMDEFYVH
jgi:murein DD-endopeptidase MepM/ murein hydrolase activator NlpD